MPLQKPSPHRFIAPSAPSSSSTPKSKPKSNLRHAVAAHTPKQTSELQFKKITPAKRFVVAPTQRSAVGDAAPRAPDRVEEPDSSASTDYTPRLRQRKLGRVESIEEASQSSPSRAADEDGFGVVQTIEHETLFGREEEGDEEGEGVEHARSQEEEENDEDEDDLLFEARPPPKRRRHASPPQQSPRTPAAAAATATNHHFRPAHTHAPHTPISFTSLNALAPTTSIPTPKTSIPTATTPAPQRRHFILPAPPTSPQKPSRPLPEIFSPSRKNQRYISSGLASTVQGWIIEAAQGGAAGTSSSGVYGGHEAKNQSASASAGGGGVRFKVRIRDLGSAGEIECWPGSVVFASGITDVGMYNASRAEGETQEMKILLAGQGGARGSGGVRLRVGGVVGIRAPTWDMDVDGEMWIVGVDWIVL